MGKVKHFSAQNWDSEVICASKDKPVLVDFFASWCGPCQAQAPILDLAAKELGTDVIIGKLDTEENEELSAKYRIMSIPSLKIFQNGEIVEEMLGLNSKENIVKAIKKYIK